MTHTTPGVLNGVIRRCIVVGMTTNHTSAAAALDFSSLARFSTASLYDILNDRRRMRRRMADQFGKDSKQHQFAIQSIYRVVCEIQDRGAEVTV